jgi:hypothetical protein
VPSHRSSQPPSDRQAQPPAEAQPPAQEEPQDEAEGFDRFPDTVSELETEMGENDNQWNQYNAQQRPRNNLEGLQQAKKELVEWNTMSFSDDKDIFILEVFNVAAQMAKKMNQMVAPLKEKFEAKYPLEQKEQNYQNNYRFVLENVNSQFGELGRYLEAMVEYVWIETDVAQRGGQVQKNPYNIIFAAERESLIAKVAQLNNELLAEKLSVEISNKKNEKLMLEGVDLQNQANGTKTRLEATISELTQNNTRTTSERDDKALENDQ